MFDTTALSESFTRKPDIDLLVRNGCEVFFNQRTGEPQRLVLNGQRKAKEPRLTISKSPLEHWIIRAEVSMGAWFYGSNIYLPTEQDLKDFFPFLTEFVVSKTGINFDARKARCTRLDATRDFVIGESQVSKVIQSLNRFSLPKYKRKPYDDTGLRFENNTKKYCFYDKHLDLLDKGESGEALERAKGVLRMEVRHINNRAVSNLAKSLKLPCHNGELMIAPEISERVLEKSMQLFNLDSLLNQPDAKLKILADSFDSSKPLLHAGHLLFKQMFGCNYAEVLGMNLSKKTIRNYERECRQVGVLSLE